MTLNTEDDNCQRCSSCASVLVCVDTETFDQFDGHSILYQLYIIYTCKYLDLSYNRNVVYNCNQYIIHTHVNI